MLAVVAYFFVSFFNLKTQISRRGSIEEISVKRQFQQDENDEFQRILPKRHHEICRKRARDEDLGCVKPNERVYYDLAVSQ